MYPKPPSSAPYKPPRRRITGSLNAKTWKRGPGMGQPLPRVSRGGPTKTVPGQAEPQSPINRRARRVLRRKLRRI